MTASRVAAVLMLVLGGGVTANWLIGPPKVPAGLSEWAMHAVEGKLGYRASEDPALVLERRMLFSGWTAWKAAPGGFDLPLPAEKDAALVATAGEPQPPEWTHDAWQLAIPVRLAEVRGGTVIHSRDVIAHVTVRQRHGQDTGGFSLDDSVGVSLVSPGDHAPRRTGAG